MLELSLSTGTGGLLFVNSVVFSIIIVGIDMRTTKTWMRQMETRGDDPSKRESSKPLARLVRQHGINGGWQRYAPQEWVVILLFNLMLCYSMIVFLGILGIGVADVLSFGIFYWVTLRRNLKAIRMGGTISKGGNVIS